MRQLAPAAAVFAALLPAAAPVSAQAAVPPGQVYFWPESGQMGGAWAYSPPGYREAEPRLKRHAAMRGTPTP
ncbi:hypothetical protein ACFWOB_31100 [Streptomyces sp. NPDC058420]|uniref:hypothetical protein n=1 Tax=Streptomyces sp. NPDC058420 TaxID=3346489 RepID=UPI00365B6754